MHDCILRIQKHTRSSIVVTSITERFAIEARNIQVELTVYILIKLYIKQQSTKQDSIQANNVRRKLPARTYDRRFFASWGFKVSNSFFSDPKKASWSYSGLCSPVDEKCSSLDNFPSWTLELSSLGFAKERVRHVTSTRMDKISFILWSENYKLQNSRANSDDVQLECQLI